MITPHWLSVNALDGFCSIHLRLNVFLDEAALGGGIEPTAVLLGEAGILLEGIVYLADSRDGNICTGVPSHVRDQASHASVSWRMVMTGILFFLLGLAFLWALYTHLPTISLLWRPSWSRNEFEAAGEGPVRIGGPAIQPLVAELEGLGFKFIGTRCELRPLWGKEFVLTFVSGDGATFADVGLKKSELPLIGRAKAWCLFFTLFKDGSWTMTSSFHRKHTATDRFEVSGLPGESPGSIWAAHQKAIATWVARGKEPRSSVGPEMRMEATRVYYESSQGRSFRWIDGVSSLFDLLLILAAILAVWYVMDSIPAL